MKYAKTIEEAEDKLLELLDEHNLWKLENPKEKVIKTTIKEEKDDYDYTTVFVYCSERSFQNKRASVEKRGANC